MPIEKGGRRGPSRSRWPAGFARFFCAGRRTRWRPIFRPRPKSPSWSRWRPHSRTFTKAIRLAMQDRVRQAIAERGLARSGIIILEALLKLRQACCHPRLREEAEGEPSLGRLDRRSSSGFWRCWRRCCEEGRRCLLFSQFTSMLALIEEALDRAGISYVAPDRRRHATAPPRSSVSRSGDGAAVPDQPEGGRHRAEPDRRRYCDSLRSVVEPGRRGPGDGSRAPSRPDQGGIRAPPDHPRHGRGEDGGAEIAQAGAGRGHSG